MTPNQEEYIKTLYTQIKDTYIELSEKDMPELKREDFYLFHDTGNRLVYENAYFGRRKFLTVYAILALWSDKLEVYGIEKENPQKYIERLEKILLEICAEKFWALPAHIDFNAIDESETALTIDLFAAETAQALSEITARLGDRLSLNVTKTVRCEVERRVMNPFLSSNSPYSWWEVDRCNWSAVCAGSIGMTAISLNHPKKQECIKRVCAAMQCYLDGMENDGACTEGLGYYNYGMSFYAAFAEALCEDGERYGYEYEKLMYRPKCEQIALFQQKCYFGGGVSLSFSDAGGRESFLTGLTAYLKHCYPEVQTPDYALARPFDEDSCYRYLTNERSISWLIKYADSDTAQETSKNSAITVDFLPSAQWLICKDANQNGFAIKGGNNDENHNHNDIGHFLCVYNGEMLLTDLGAGEYTKDYFSDKRYEILCNRSLGHSVPIINGCEQCVGGSYKADSFVWDEENGTLKTSFASAYPNGIIQKLERTIGMCEDKSGMNVRVSDTFVTAKNTTEIVENLVTEHKPIVDNDSVVIKGKNGICRIEIEVCADSYVKKIKCVKSEEIRVVERIHSNHAGYPRTVYLIRWEVPFSGSHTVECVMWITCR